MRKYWLAIALFCLMTTSCGNLIPDPYLQEKVIAVLWMENHTDILNVCVESEGLCIPNSSFVLDSKLTPKEVNDYIQHGDPEYYYRRLPVYTTLCAYGCDPKSMIDNILKEKPDAKISVYVCNGGSKDNPIKGELLIEWRLSELNIMPYTTVTHDIYDKNKNFFFIWDE